MGEGIRRVVWVPKELDKEIEKTRHKIGYTRSEFYRYAITRSLEDLFLHKQKAISLQAWEEIVGVLQGVRIDKEITTAIITCIRHIDYLITYPNETQEAQILQKIQKLKGQKVALLKTDLPHNPLIVRAFNDHSMASDKNTKTINPMIVTGKSPENLHKANHEEQTPKIGQEKHVPKIYPDHSWWM